MTTSLPLLLVLATVGGGGHRPPLIRYVGDPARGLLVNRSAGLRPFDPPDPAGPTVVFIHGFNPLPRHLRFTMGEQLAAAVARRHGPGAINVLEWDWNAATFVGPRPKANDDAAEAQGPPLADALTLAGIDPGRAHLIGHSNGAIVAASAARLLAARGRVVAQVTYLESATLYHDRVFQQAVGPTIARRVENIWAAGPSGFGRAVDRPGIVNVRVDGRTPYLGVVLPTHSGHLDAVRWYIDGVNDPARTDGFNASALLSK